MTLLLDETHDPRRRSWVESANGHGDFPIQNLPLGIVARPNTQPHAATAIGDCVLDLKAAAAAGLLPGELAAALQEPTLNALLGQPAEARRSLRRRLSELLSDEAHRDAVASLLFERKDSVAHLPARIGDYTDFYAGIHHAMNIGRLLRPDNPLLPNYKYVPIAYHGRASSIRPSDVPVVRPHGQCKAPDAGTPKFEPSQRLDYELEFGIWIGEGNRLGQQIPIARAAGHIAGFCLLNDWSARDLQAWEYQPLGPFLAKSFHSTISPWIVTTQALAPFRVAQPPRPVDDPAPLPHLWDAADQHHGALSIMLEVSLSTAAMRTRGQAPHRLSRGPATSMYWTPAQLVAHHASNGCNLNPGDLLGTGTISAPEPGGCGSLMEISQGGAAPVSLPSGERRRFLEDGDEVVLSATAAAPGFVPIGFGACRAIVVPSRGPSS